MYNLDMRTVLLLFVFSNVVCSLLITILWLQHRYRYAGINFLVWNYVFQSIAILLVALRGSILDFFSILFSNALIVAGSIIGYRGLERFLGGKKSHTHNYLLLLIFVLIHAYFLYVKPDLAIRTLNLSVNLFIICLQCSWLLLYQVQPKMRRLTFGTGIVFGAFCLVSLLRAAEFFTAPHPVNDFFQSGEFQVFVLTLYQLLFVLLTFGIVWMVNGHLLMEIRNSEEIFSLFIKRSPIYAFIKEVTKGKSTTLYASDNYLQMVGIPGDKMSGKPMEELFLPEFAANITGDNRAVVSEGKVITFNEKLNGRSYTTVKFPITVSNKNLLAGYSIDITERKQIENELRASVSMYQSLFENMHEGFAYHRMIFLDGRPYDYQYLLVNPSFEHLTGLRNVVGEYVSEVIPGIRKDNAELFEIYGRVVMTGKSETFETYVPALNNWYSVSVYRPHDDHFITLFNNITERKRREEKLQASSEKFVRVQEISHLGSWEYDIVTDKIVWSDEVYRIFGLVPQQDEITIKLIQGMIHPDDRDKVYGALQDTAEGYASHDIEYRIIRPDGRIRYVHSHRDLPRSEQNQRYIFGILHDITERRRSEDLVRARMELLEIGANHPWEDFLQKVLDKICDRVNSLIGFYHFVEPDQKTLSLQAWSTRTIREFCTAIGKGTHYGIDKAGVWVQCVHERKAVIHNDYASLTNKKGLPAGHAAVIRELVVPIIRNESIVAILGVGNKPCDYTEDDAETVSYLADVAWEITLKKQAERSLRESASELQLLIDNAPDAIFIYYDGKFVYLNQRAVQLFGADSAEELKGCPVVDQIHPNYHEIMREQLRLLLLTGEHKEVKPMDQKYIRMNGSEVDVEVSAVPVTYSGKASSLWFARDITERKQLEEEILKTRKLESLGMLAGGIAHDLNNLLQGITGNADVAKSYLVGRDIENASTAIERIQKTSEAAAGLSSRFLIFSKGGVPLKKISSIDQLIEKALYYFPASSSIELQYTISTQVTPVEVDEALMTQVLVNIINNARESIPTTGIVKIIVENASIELDDSALIKPGFYVKISISDDGIGISQDNLQKIFDPYFSTKGLGSNPGIGLGLSVCHAIIKQHEGHIDINSEVGKGTTVTVYLPAVEVLSKPIVKNVEKHPGHKGRKRILIMDDDEMVRDAIGTMVEYLGHEAAYAGDGEEAIALYKGRKTSDPFDAAIFDLTVQGGMGGKEAMQKLVKFDPEVKVIVTSGYSTDPVVQNFRKYGFVDVLAKPYSIHQLKDLLERL